MMNLLLVLSCVLLMVLVVTGINTLCVRATVKQEWKLHEINKNTIIITRPVSLQADDLETVRTLADIHKCTTSKNYGLALSKSLKFIQKYNHQTSYVSVVKSDSTLLRRLLLFEDGIQTNFNLNYIFNLKSQFRPLLS